MTKILGIQYKKALKAFDDIVFNTRKIIRPDRKNERIHRRKKPYSTSWSPSTAIDSVFGLLEHLTNKTNTDYIREIVGFKSS